MKKILLMLAISTSSVLAAQEPHVLNTRYMFWPGILGEYKLTRDWSVFLDAQFRYEYTDGDVFQWYARPSVTRKLNNGLLLSIGASYFQLYPNPNGRVARQELRPWQEVGYKFKPSAKHVLYPRARVEQRFIREYSGAGLASDYTFHSFRLRLRFDYTWFAATEDKASPWFFFAGNELFLLQRTNGFSAFDQNRTWAGVGYMFNANHNVQLSYVYLYQQQNSNVADQFYIARIIYQFTIAREAKEEVK